MGTEMSGRECERLLQPDELLGIQLGLQLVAGLNDLWGVFLDLLVFYLIERW